MIEKFLANPGRVLAIVQIILAVCIAVSYLTVKDYRRAIYWLAAAVLTTTVTI